MFKSHLEMIGRNETASKKAKFWQSFVRSLKGSEDIRADDTKRPSSIFRPISDYDSTWPYGKSIYEDPIHAAERITIPGYRYDPLHRDTYGYSPRQIYPHNYGSLDRYRPVFHVSKLKPFDADAAWREHVDRVTKREPSIFHTTYPFSRYPLYLVYSKKAQRPKPQYDPHKDWLDSLDRLNLLDRLNHYWPRSMSPTPIKPGEWGPRANEIGYNYAGQPIFSLGGFRPSKSIFDDLINPSPYVPMSAIARDPWWHYCPSLRPYRPYSSWGRSPYWLRDSYLSPVKRTYLWDKHPCRPFSAVY
ncbi:uncharacterized protein Mf isoform X1 [Atheta coriaria]|uniref:uncharacterized protein Mf isoform X1 n=1 Tax=Dalotia coriaria TaxID=877792 RepID=UPI0031F416DE